MKHSYKYDKTIEGKQLIRYAHNFVVTCFVVGRLCADLFTDILQDYFTDSGAMVWLPLCQWSNPEEYGYNWSIPYPIKTKNR